MFIPGCFKKWWLSSDGQVLQDSLANIIEGITKVVSRWHRGTIAGCERSFFYNAARAMFAMQPEHGHGHIEQIKLYTFQTLFLKGFDLKSQGCTRALRRSEKTDEFMSSLRKHPHTLSVLFAVKIEKMVYLWKDTFCCVKYFVVMIYLLLVYRWKDMLFLRWSTHSQSPNDCYRWSKRELKGTFPGCVGWTRPAGPSCIIW